MNVGNRTRTLIFSFAGDYHAHAVAWALRQKGHDADILLLDQIPSRGTLTADPALTHAVSFVVDGHESRLDSYDRFWLRRPMDAILPAAVHAADMEVAQSAWNSMRDALMSSISSSTSFVVDRVPSRALGRLKFLQLQIASQLGIEIPRTIFTNRATDVASFIKSNAGKGCNTVVKGLEQFDWDLHGGGQVKFMTARVRLSDIDTESIELAPNIFQEELVKLAEIRLLILGHSMFAARLDTQGSADSVVDYRLSADMKKLGAMKIEIPDDVRSRITEFMRITGSISGSMDFIVTHDGRWVFLELNPAGQFLWIENINPELPILDAFAEFVVYGVDYFSYEESSSGRVHLSDFDVYLDTPAGHFIRQEAERAVLPTPRQPDRRLSVTL